MEAIIARSPIEKAFLKAYLETAAAFDMAVGSVCHRRERLHLYLEDDHHWWLGTSDRKNTARAFDVRWDTRRHGTIFGPDPVDVDVTVAHQVQAFGYRMDFAILSHVANEFVLCVELDGHDWHERTKQQASQDRARDRELLALGIVTMRFTGADVHRDPVACAREVHAFVRAQHARIARVEQTIADDAATQAVYYVANANGCPASSVEAVPVDTLFDSARSETRSSKYAMRRWQLLSEKRTKHA